MSNKRSIFKDIASGIFIAAIILFICYIVFIFNFYDIYLYCKLMRTNVEFQARQIEREANLKAEEILLKEEAKAYKDFSLSAWGYMEQKEKTGLNMIFDKTVKMLNARNRYKDRLKQAQKKAETVKLEAKKSKDTLIGKAKKDFCPFYLVLMGNTKSQLSTTGYFYDPKTGDIVPKLDYIEK